MTIQRLPSPRARGFYPYDERSCRQQIEEYLEDYQPPQEPTQIVAGIVPHAGWGYSGPTAAKVFKNVKEKALPETFIIFGTIHRVLVTKAAMFDNGTWKGPFGAAPVDEELANLILDVASDNVTANPSAHKEEHSIEVQIPFIQYFFPEAKILPIMVPPGERAPELGQQIGKVLFEQKKRKVFILGTTDLTHYGGLSSYGFTPYGSGPQAFASMKENDQRMINIVIEMKAEEVIPEAEQHRNACGAGAIAATVAAAKELGATCGYLLEYITSQDVIPEPYFTTAVGYAGIVF